MQSEEYNTIKGKIESLSKTLKEFKKQLHYNEQISIEESLNTHYQNFVNSLNILITAIEDEIEQYNQTLSRLEREHQEALKTKAMEKRNYAAMSDEELRKQNSSIRSQIKRIENKIADIYDGKEISTVYRYNDFGEVILVKVDDLPIAEMVYEMREIIADLEERLNDIEENYKGTSLKEIPIFDESDDTYDFDESILEEDGIIKGRKL